MKLALGLILCFGLSAQQPNSAVVPMLGNATVINDLSQHMMASVYDSVPASAPKDDFTVEKLTTDEQKKLADAREKARLANAELEHTETAVKEAHGQPPPNRSGTTNAVCIGSSKTVELRGEYALITNSYWSSCGGISWQ